MKAVLNSMMGDTGGQFVMMPGTSMMLKLYADSLDVAGPQVPQEMHILDKAQTPFSWMM